MQAVGQWAVAALIGISSTSVFAGKPTAGGWEGKTVTASFQPLAVEADGAINPLKGYYRWRGLEVVPQGERALDAYQRYHWRDLEPTPGNFNFSALLNDLATARSEGRKFAFRIRMMAGYDDGQIYLPADLVGHPSCVAGCGFWADDDPAKSGLTFVPDWNDPYLQQRARHMMTSLATALGSSTADLAWIDVGLYGQYGEWTIHSGLYASAPSGITPITEASKRGFADMHFQAFPGVRQVMFALYSNREALNYGLNQQTLTQLPVGLRVDCLSRAGFFDQWLNHPTDWAQFSNRWQTAPFVAEFCNFESGDPLNNPATARQQAAQFHISTIGNGNFANGVSLSQRWASLSPQEQSDLTALGREAGYRYALTQSSVTLTTAGVLSVSAGLQNLGNAPAYEPWSVRVELRSGAGATVWTGALPGSLGSSMGGGSSQSTSGTWTLPKTLASGGYSLHLTVRSGLTTAPRRALLLANAERAADASIPLTTLRKK
ncbi:DUF4832 domain-containing protein [Inhella gelatinilytica]|uniref:DUF4832 domain-containing protein n=1 Tax=Inhella gelatinilytica TaxID=2795030 RepID=A0A931NC02_9BURK|nr:DUF4832 domain-containing protein [Inhella gelatinilytica]MBH9554148.1 DUF4832 domain-containing protein [Inhella gelatinilytica]